MSNRKPYFHRTSLLLGDKVMQRLEDVRVIIFGVGGVGSWCAEGLIRSGVENLTIVDSDTVCLTNVNRQMMATVNTVGRVKVDALKERLLEINPDAKIVAIKTIYTSDTAKDFDLASYDYIVDAIDSLKDKVTLILKATNSRGKFYSSMGAALKIDPTGIEVSEFWKVKGCPLARALRQRFKKLKEYPAKKFLCVYSEEHNENKKEESGDPSLIENKGNFKKAQVNGSLMHITAMFGLTLAGLIIKDNLIDS